jgi:hypothetical protein
MNIFKSLSQGHGTISETNITSFLSYLLNSTNELDNSFLVLFFELIDKKLEKNKVCDLLKLKQENLRQRILYFSKEFSVNAIPEFSVQKDNKKQIIDVLVTVSDKKEETDVAFLLIENKIKTVSANKLQVSKQFEYFTQREEYSKNKLPVYSIVLTSDFETFSAMHSNAVDSNPCSVWIKWTNKKEKEQCVEGVLRRLLILEQQAEIQPINPNTQFILKSFIDYIVTEFSNSATGGRNFSFNGSNEVEKTSVSFNGDSFTLRRYENKMIRVFDGKDEVVDMEVLPFLKQLNEKFKLGVEINHSTGTPKNTQVFGREVIGAMNRTNS